MMQLIWMILAGSLAFLTGRGMIKWTIAVYLLGPLPLLVLAFLPSKQDKIQKRIDFFTEKSEEHLVKKEFQDVDTVDDLFKQLETK